MQKHAGPHAGQRRGDRSLAALAAEVRAGLAALHPTVFSYPRLALALAIGALGGWVFARLALPLPWMLGPMTFCTVAALLQAPLKGPGPLRAPMIVVIGVLLGSGVTPAFIGQVAAWLPVVIGLLLFMAAAGLCCVPYFRRIGGFDPVTAFFAGMPGGLVEMVALGEERGGDPRMIALVHSARVLLVVMSLPFLVQAIEGAALGTARPPGQSILDAALGADLWLVGSALAGLVLGHVARLPSKTVTGPMLVSGFVHAVGWSDFKPPSELVIVAQVVLGTGIGCSFAGLAAREIGRVLALTAGATLILVTLTALFAVAVGRMTGIAPSTLMLAYSPGGMAEMSLIALALNLDVALVASMHMLRLLAVMLGAAVIYRWLNGGPGASGEKPP